MSSLIGASIRRREDPPLLTGEAVFASDPRPAGLAHLSVIRSPLAHARVRGVRLDAVRAATGVLAAWSASDAPGLTLAPAFPLPGAELRPRPVLAAAEVSYVGDPLAVVVASDRYAAEDAALLADLDLEPLPAAAGAERGEAAASLRRTFGDAEAEFGAAEVVVAAGLRLARVAGGYLEPRSVTAEPHEDGVVLRTSTQWAHGVRDAVAAALGLDPSKVRVLATHVGGAFGAKGMPYPEEVLVAMAAMRLGRPVAWVAGRTEDMLASAQSHGTVMDLELAASSDARIRGLRGRILHPIGAYAASGPGQADNIASHLVSCYRLPSFDVTVDMVYTNTVPSGFVRGGGREVGNFAMERLMDRLALRLGIDAVEVRRRNLIQPDEMPYDTGYRSPRGTFVYDGGDYPAMLDRALEAIGPAGPAQGLGVACFAESTGIGAPETARLAISPDGMATVYVGTSPQGQGHSTAAAQVTAGNLGWPLDGVRVVSGDSAAVPMSYNTAASRSAVEMGAAAARAGREARRRLLELASERLEADPSDIEVGPGGAAPRGVPERRVALSDLVPEGLEVTETYDAQRRRTYASGCAATLVDVDAETGAVAVRKQVLVHDIGRAINPLIVEGQGHGAYAHGLGYALYEEIAHDDAATPLTSGFLDYTMVSAAEVAAEPELYEHNTPALHSAEGFRGAGEGGTIPIPAAIASAVEHALRRRGIEVFVDELPITPERLRRLIAKSSQAARGDER